LDRVKSLDDHHLSATHDPTLSFTPLLPTPHTRKRLPQGGFVQTGFEAINNDLREADFWPGTGFLDDEQRLIG